MKTRKGIRRVADTQARRKGWQVSLNRQSGKIYRLFTDGMHGGYHKAYRAASAWLDRILPLHPACDRLAKSWPADGSDRPGAYWAAQWIETPHEKRQRRKFSVAHYGEKQAKRLAIAAREEALEKMAAAAGA